MKAKNKKTGRIVDLKYAHTKNNNGTLVDYFTEINGNQSDGLCYPETDFDFDDTADWEQRRYEITRELAVGLFCGKRGDLGEVILSQRCTLPEKCENIAGLSVLLADEIIKALRSKERINDE